MITRDMVSASDVHTFYADASDLGWPPGHWPNSVPTDMGNGQPFLLWSRIADYALYRQGNGVLVLRVWND
jgi:hypothetical protein